MARRGHTTINIGQARNSSFPKSIISLFLLFSGLLPSPFIIPSLLASSCTRTDDPSLQPGRPIRLDLTKGSEIRRADVFFYHDDATRRLDAYQRFESPDAYVNALSTAGRKIAVLVVNSPADIYGWGEVNSFESLASRRMRLDEDKPSSPISSGMLHLDAGTDGGGKVLLKPLMSKIVLNSLRCDFRGRSYEGAVMDNTRIFLINASTSSTLLQDSLPVQYFNEGREDGASPQFLACEGIGTVGDKTIFPDAELFCYGNPATKDGPGTPLTRLVVQGDIGGQTYYYPVSLPGLTRGCTVSVDLEITRTGTDDPDAVLQAGVYSAMLSVLPWEEKPLQTVRF